jgi:lysophospholipase L1-like esterase
MISLLIAEIGLRLVARVPDPTESDKRLKHYIISQWPPYVHYTITVEKGLPGVSGPTRFTTNNMGFRGSDLVNPKPPGEFRIFMVGGSTTECFLLDDHHAIDAVLQRELAKLDHSGRTIKVYNAAKSGDKTVDHIAMIGHRIAHLEPDMIIVFAGINDLRPYDYLHLYNQQRERLSLLRLLVLASTEFQLPRRVYYSLSRYQKAFGAVTLETSIKKEARIRREAPIMNEKPVDNTAPYRDNLLTIAGVARAHRIRLVYMTQQETWNSKVDPQAEEWQWLLYVPEARRTHRADLMDTALESLNDVMRQVAVDRQIPLYDLRKILPQSTEFFYDDMHFNVKGAQAAGKGLAEFLIGRRLLESRPPANE